MCFGWVKGSCVGWDGGCDMGGGCECGCEGVGDCWEVVGMTSGGGANHPKDGPWGWREYGYCGDRRWWWLKGIWVR